MSCHITHCCVCRTDVYAAVLITVVLLTLTQPLRDIGGPPWGLWRGSSPPPQSPPLPPPSSPPPATPRPQPRPRVTSHQPTDHRKRRFGRLNPPAVSESLRLRLPAPPRLSALLPAAPVGPPPPAPPAAAAAATPPPPQRRSRERPPLSGSLSGRGGAATARDGISPSHVFTHYFQYRRGRRAVGFSHSL